MCFEEVEKKNITVSENNRQFRIKNPALKTVNIIHVDGCLIEVTSSDIRCDYAFEIFESKSSKNKIENKIDSVVYVELKGRNVEHAYDQIVATLNHLKNRHCNVNAKQAFIVASRVPKGGPKVQNLKLKLAKSQNVQLFVKTKLAEVTI